MPRIALVLTVKNEERVLRSNLQYHNAIGAEHIFVYFDNTTDRGLESIADLDYVSSQKSVAAHNYASIEALHKFTSQAKKHHTARQCLNTYSALEQCRELGIDWLISLDADELVCTNLEDPSNINSFFDQIPQETQVVYLQTKEALQQQEHYNNVFEEITIFKNTHKYKKRFEKIFKRFENPFTKQEQYFSYWYGQHLGKGAIRVASPIIPHNVHKYKQENGEEAIVLKCGFVLHYHAYDAQDFIKKFKNFSNRPDTYLSGNKVATLKLLLRDIVNSAGYNQQELKTYFKNNLLFSAAEIKKLKANKYLVFFKRKEAPLITITSVQKVFKSLLK